MGETSRTLTQDTQLFHDLFNASPIGIAVENLEGQPLFVNPSFCSFLGFSEEELRNKHCVDFSPREDAEKDWALFQQLRAGSINRYQLEKRYFRRDGSLVWGRLNISLFKSHPSPLIIAMVEDITDKKRAAEELHDSEERLRLAVQAGRMFAYSWDAVTDVVARSGESAEILGVKNNQAATGAAVSEMVYPDDKQRLETAVARLTVENPTLQITYRITRPNGLMAWLERNSRAYFDEHGKVKRIVGMIVDVTERQHAEQALREKNDALETQTRVLQSQEELLRIFVQNVPAGVAMLDHDMRYLQVSDRWCTDYGLSATHVLGRSHYEIFPDLPERWKEIHRRGLAGETLRAEEDRWDREGGTIWSRWEIRPWKNRDGLPGGILIFSEDVTRRKQMEGALIESEDKFRLLLDSTAEAIYGIDLEHRCTFCNPACFRTLGHERMDEVVGKNMHDMIHHTRADGTVLPVEECLVHRVASTGEGVHAEDEVFWRASGTSFPVEYWSYPQRRGDKVVGAVVAFIDITERKLTEAALANVSRKLIEAQEQERNRISRELHDNIGQRLALLSFELEELHEDPSILLEVRSRIDELQKQSVEIASDIQSLSHELDSAKLQYLGIARAMKGFCQEFGEQQKVEIDFQTYELPGPLSPDISLCFFRVLQEALHNSAKHSGVRHFEVRLWGTSDEIHLTVSDSGAGFAREAAKTSRGLGLISMEERLKLVNGTLSIDSQPKRGTTIHARVPIVSGSDSMRAAG